MAKKNGAHKHLRSQEVKYSAWACQPKKPRIDSMVKDRRQADCKDCLAVPIVCGPLVVSRPHAAQR